MIMNIAVYDRKKLHQVPPILQDFALQMQALDNTPEVRENYAQKFEIIKDYAEYCLDIHEQLKREFNKPVRRRK